MAVPAALANFRVYSDGSVITIAHDASAAVAAVKGYRYFRSSVSLADALAMVAADTGLASPSGMILDAGQVVVSGLTYSRGAVLGTVTFSEDLAYGTYYYAAVARNADGASAAVSATVVHSAAAAKYPLTTVILDALTAANGTITAVVTPDLNLVDQTICDSFGPFVVDAGGIFGITAQNPNGVTIAQDLVKLVGGVVLKKTFYVEGYPDRAAVAAAEWQSTMVNRISTTLTTARAVDTATVLEGVRLIQV